eukprot:Nk52_evm1s235 gene=Nk52_evmTU1s235
MSKPTRVSRVEPSGIQTKDHKLSRPGVVQKSVSSFSKPKDREVTLVPSKSNVLDETKISKDYFSEELLMPIRENWSSFDVVSHHMVIVLKYSANLKAAELLVKLNLVPDLVKCIRTYSKRYELMRTVATISYNICLCQANMNDILKTPLLTELHKLVKHHSSADISQQLVTEHFLGVVTAISGVQEGLQTIVREGCIPTIISFMKEDTENVFPTYNCALAIRRLSNSEDMRKMLVRKGCVDLLHQKYCRLGGNVLNKRPFNASSNSNPNAGGGINHGNYSKEALGAIIFALAGLAREKNALIQIAESEMPSEIVSWILQYSPKLHDSGNDENYIIFGSIEILFMALQGDYFKSTDIITKLLEALVGLLEVDPLQPDIMVKLLLMFQWYSSQSIWRKKIIEDYYNAIAGMINILYKNVHDPSISVLAINIVKNLAICKSFSKINVKEEVLPLVLLCGTLIIKSQDALGKSGSALVKDIITALSNICTTTPGCIRAVCKSEFVKFLLDDYVASLSPIRECNFEVLQIEISHFMRVLCEKPSVFVDALAVVVHTHGNLKILKTMCDTITKVLTFPRFTFQGAIQVAKYWMHVFMILVMFPATTSSTSGALVPSHEEDQQLPLLELSENMTKDENCKLDFVVTKDSLVLLLIVWKTFKEESAVMERVGVIFQYISASPKGRKLLGASLADALAFKHTLTSDRQNAVYTGQLNIRQPGKAPETSSMQPDREYDDLQLTARQVPLNNSLSSNSVIHAQQIMSRNDVLQYNETAALNIDINAPDTSNYVEAGGERSEYLQYFLMLAAETLVYHKNSLPIVGGMVVSLYNIISQSSKFASRVNNDLIAKIVFATSSNSNIDAGKEFGHDAELIGASSYKSHGYNNSVDHEAASLQYNLAGAPSINSNTNYNNVSSEQIQQDCKDLLDLLRAKLKKYNS